LDHGATMLLLTDCPDRAVPLLPSPPEPEPLARGEVLGLEPDLGLRLQGRAEPMARGRLAFEHACRRFGL
jgi:hypothetical protein